MVVGHWPDMTWGHNNCEQLTHNHLGFCEFFRWIDPVVRKLWTVTHERWPWPGLCSTHFFGLTRLWLIWQSRWLNSDSTQIPNLLTWPNSDSTQNPNLLIWLNSDSTHLSQRWVKSDSRLITFYLIWEKVADRGGGGGVRSNVAVGWFFLCKVTDNCKILTFSLRKISDSTLIQAVSSWLNSDSNDNQRDSTLTRLISWIFTDESTLTRLIWVRDESNLTHDSWVEHNPGRGHPRSQTASLCSVHCLFLLTLSISLKTGWPSGHQRGL